MDRQATSHAPQKLAGCLLIKSSGDSLFQLVQPFLQTPMVAESHGGRFVVPTKDLGAHNRQGVNHTLAQRRAKDA
eukprot:9214992-Prorocentrum_lima.AAC.1